MQLITGKRLMDHIVHAALNAALTMLRHHIGGHRHYGQLRQLMHSFIIAPALGGFRAIQLRHLHIH
tara:strand:- start:169 stop:366 length:198 start_codon:yes stop_codon:yes gene_type:complete